MTDARRRGTAARLDLLRLCEVFVTVAEEQHFGAAADRLGITQPPVSQGLRRLEEHWGVRLVDRGRDGAVLTDVGRRLLPLARTLVRDAAHLESEAAAHTESPDLVVIGIGATVPPRLATSAVAGLAAVASEVRVTRRDSGTLIDGLVVGELGVAVIEDPHPTGDLARGALHRIPRSLLVPAPASRSQGSPTSADDAPVSDRRSRDTGTGWRAGRGLPLALTRRDAGPAAFDRLVDQASQGGAAAEVWQVDSVEDALLLVAAGRAVTVSDPWGGDVSGVRRLPLPESADQRLRVLVRPERASLADGRDLRSVLDRAVRDALREAG